MKAFGIAVSEDIVANLITAVLLAGGIMGFWFSRYAIREQRWRRWIPPQRRIFPLATSEPNHWAVDHTPFQNPVRIDERQRLVDWYSQRMQSHPTNGQIVRLDGLDPWRFSSVDFFDFLTTNLTAFPANWPRASWGQHWQAWWHWWSVFPLIQRVRAQIGQPQSGSEVLLNHHLANPLAVSVLLQDVTGRWGVVARSHHVAVASGQWGTTAAGTVSPDDLVHFPEHPIAVCARREAQEELNLILGALTWDGLVIARQKMQPIALVSGCLARQWEEVLPLIAHARDWSFENRAFYAVPAEQIAPIIRQAPLTDAAAYHLQLHQSPGLGRLRRIHLDHYCLAIPTFSHDASEAQ